MYEELEAPSRKPARRYVQFGHHPAKDEAKSLEAGRPIYADAEYIEISIPGDKFNVVHRPVRPTDKVEFAEEYRRFKAGEAMQQSGTPLEKWPGISRAEVLELQHFRIFTVEQLADVADGNAKDLGPVLALRERARDFIAAAKGNAPVEKMRAELAKRDEQIAAMQAQIEALAKAPQHEAKKGGK